MTQELRKDERYARDTSGARVAGAPAKESCRGLFPPHYEVERAAGGDGAARFIVTDAETNLSWGLGAAELTVARLFDASRTYEEIAATLRSAHRVNTSTEQLMTFERRLIKLGVLRGGSDAAPPVDPLSGVNFGPLHSLLVITLLRLNPEPTLTRLVSRCPWVVSGLMTWAALVISAAGIGVILYHRQIIGESLASTVSGWWWLLWLYLIISASGIFHEGGHMLCCKAFNVRTHNAGFMIYFFLPFAWTTPNQSDWGRLSPRGRVLTTLAGPLGSLTFGGLSSILWGLAPAGSIGQHLGVYGVIAGAYGAGLTLLPFLNGDGYILLTELFRLPNLRSKSFNYLKSLLPGGVKYRSRPLRRRTRVLYLFVALGTLAGWLALGGALTVFILNAMR